LDRYETKLNYLTGFGVDQNYYHRNTLILEIKPEDNHTHVYIFTRNGPVMRRGWHNIRILRYGVSSCNFHSEHFSDPFVHVIVLE
jgi:hypothetical protein